MTAPLVSIVIPTYNGAAHIERTLRSALAQSYPEVEILVVDDASRDDTLAVVQEVDDGRVRVHRAATNRGAAANWNDAVRRASGPYVKLLCQDDVLDPGCVERQVAALQAEPRAALAASPRRIIDERDRVVLPARGLEGWTGVVSGREVCRRVLAGGGNPIGEPSSVLMRASALEASGGFDVRWSYLIDLDQWVRLLQHGTLACVEGPLSSFRVNLSSWSVRLRDQQTAETRRYLRELYAARPDLVPGRVVRLGEVRAALRSLGRQVLYAALRARR